MKETKKQIKAQLINEITKQYAKREASLKERICFLEERQIRANDRVAELENENIKLKDKVEQYEDWNRRLQEFMDMDPDARDKAIADLKVRSEISHKMKGVMDVFIKEINMKAVKPTPKAMYLYNPYIETCFPIYKPMPRFKMWFWKILLGFEYREEL